MDRVLFKHLSGSRTSECDAFESARFEKVVIGRDPGADVRFDRNHDSVVGRRHGSVQRSAGNPARFVYSDLGSCNGTYLNDTRIQGSVDLVPGDVLQFGLGGPKCEFDVEPRPQQVPDTAIARETTTRLVASEYGWRTPVPVVDTVAIEPSRVTAARVASLAVLIAAIVGTGVVWRHRMQDAGSAQVEKTVASSPRERGEAEVLPPTTAPAVTPQPPMPPAPPAKGSTGTAQTSQIVAAKTNSGSTARPLRPAARPVAKSPTASASAGETPTENAAVANSNAPGVVHGGVIPGPHATGAAAPSEGVNESALRSFDRIELIRVQPDRTTKLDVTLRFDRDALIVADARHSATVKTIGYDSIRDVAYSMSKHARFRGNPSTAGGVLITVLSGFFKSKQHWLNIRMTDGEELILRLDKSNYEEVCDAVAGRTHKRVESLVAER